MMKKSDIFWQTYLNLEKEVIEVSKFVFITDVKAIIKDGTEVVQPCGTQLETFSPHIADLLVRCCVQIEAISKELYHDEGGQKPRGSNSILFDEDCLKLIDIRWETHKKSVLVVAPFFNLIKEENTVLRPLKEAHKRQGTYWEKAYQAVKHDRFTSIYMGTVKALLHSLAALYLLNLYYRNDSWVISYQEVSKQDYSLGSSIFAVKPPVIDQLWDGNNPISSDSPYVVTYMDDVYQRIDSIRQKESEALREYINNLPEWQEQVFVNQIQEDIKNSPNGFFVLWELGKYRLNKKIPNTLSFKERKDLLLSSEEWKGWINQHNNHLQPDEITVDNIQHEIDLVGRRWGMELMKKIQKRDWVPIAMNSGMCKVYIPNQNSITRAAF